MKKLGWVILLAAMCTVFACAALAEGTAGIQYRYDEASGTAYVTGYSGTDEAVVIPEQVNDEKMVLVAREIAKRIENEMQYPGQIKVHLIRESRAIEYAK